MPKDYGGFQSWWKFAARYSEWLVLLVLVLAAIPVVLIRRHALTVVPFFPLVDGSWTLDVAYKAASGSWLGRDVLFTYGPVYEWLASAPSRWLGTSTGTILATASMLPDLVSILAIGVGIRLLLPRAAPWRRALFLIVVLWTAPGIRLAICLFAFAAFLRLAEAVALHTAGIWLPAAATAFLCVASFLVSADAGLYTAAALVLCVSATATAKRKTPAALPRLCAYVAASLVGLVLGVVGINASMSSPLDFSYWKSSLVLAAGYRWFEPKGITAASTWRMLIALLFVISVFAIAWRHREPEGNNWTLRPAFLLAGLGLAVVMLQSGLVRSDVVHVVNGIYPMIFLCGAILVGGWTGLPRLSAALPFALVATLPLIAVPHAESFLSALGTAAGELFHPTLTCPQGKQEFDHACFSPANAQLFAAASAYIDQHTNPSDPILVFPYQNALGVMSRRSVAGGVLQGYLVNGDYLTNLDLAGLRKADPPLAIYVPDSPPSFGVPSSEIAFNYDMDGVPSFTRSPDVWFYLLQHYRSPAAPAADTFVLTRDHTHHRNLSFAQQQIADAPGTVRIGNRYSWLEFGPLHWPEAGADFVKLRLRVNYRFWWKLLKPSSLALLVHYADNSWQLVYLVVEPNRDSEVWIYTGDAREMVNYFSADHSRWPIARPPARLALLVSPFDWISVAPDSVTIEAVDAVRIRRD